MDRKNIATRYQHPTENLLMDIARLVKKSTNLIDLSIGDPDLSTDERIIEQA
ncbi:pyridoxal phosphate-dependent aminotransferase, partial [Enterococcus faecalis]